MCIRDSPHRFRHTFATWAIQSGAREIDVQMLLGHSDLTMTQRYVRTYTSEQAVQAHAALSPVAQLEALADSAEGDGPQCDANPAPDLTPRQNGPSRFRPGAEANVVTTKGAMKPGLTLVAKYKRR